MPGTRSGGWMNSDSMNTGRSIASSRSRSLIRWRPCCQVVIRVNMATPMRMGNQPPSRIFTALAAKNTMSMTKKQPVAATHSHSGSFQP